MAMTVWVDGWQMQCCGRLFAVGDVVSWTLLEADPEDYAELVGSEEGGVDFREEHHGGEGRTPTSVEVLSITEVHCRYGPRPGTVDNANRALPGTRVLVPVRQAERWVEARPGVEFAGYLVTVRRVADGGGPPG
ncbi:DUF6578 domain-containing protein [Streptomyces sp. NPDC049906]|uniref:DUF6578 domain-containing protein n=1 Tax=Streptomyces sp. NPDC049906 TaxID=3155656 RepID=UPI0034487095